MWSVCTLARSLDADTVSKDIISEQVLNNNCSEGPTATLSHDPIVVLSIVYLIVHPLPSPLAYQTQS